MINIYALPDEIVSHIFTLGCEIGSNQTTSLDTYIYPRRLKDFSLLVSLVCIRWRNITEAGSNQHLWICGVRFRDVSLFSMSDNYSLLYEIAIAKNCILQSQGCDIDIEIPLNAPSTPTAVVNLSDHDLPSTQIRIVMHFIAFVSNFIRQWRSIKIQSGQAEVLFLLLSILNDIDFAPSLVEVSFNLDQGKSFKHDSSLLSANIYGIVADIYDGYATGSTLNILSKFCGSGIFHFTGMPVDTFERLSNMKHLRLTACRTESRTSSWRVLSRASSVLVTLHISEDIHRTLREDFQSPILRGSFTSLTELKFDTIITLGRIHDVLQTVDFNSLAVFMLHDRYGVAKRLSSYERGLGFKDSRLPRLERLELRLRPEAVVFFIHILDTPRLHTLNIHVLNADAREVIPGNILHTPECLILSGFAMSFLRHFSAAFNFDSTESFTFSENFFERDPLIIDETWPSLSFRALSSLNIAGVCVTQFLLDTQIDSLQSV